MKFQVMAQLREFRHISKFFSALTCALVMATSAATVMADDGQPYVPAAIKKAARTYKVNLNDVVISIVPLDRVVVDAKGKLDRKTTQPLYALNAYREHKPASVVKLVTTLASLEVLGGNYHWYTSFYADGPLDSSGKLQGNLYIRGGGDPTFVIEDFALVLTQLRQMGIRKIEGDIVVDRSFFKIPHVDPSAFDGKGNRPYNLPPDAALINYRNLSFDFYPNYKEMTAKVVAVPALDGVTYQHTIRMKKGGCWDFKSAIGYQLKTNGDKKSVVFNGYLPSACGAKNFNVISFEANDYLERLFRNLWQKEGGVWSGHVKDGQVPAGARRLYMRMSPSLVEAVSLTNKWSNNTMARHIFLSLGQNYNAKDWKAQDVADGPYMAFAPAGTLEGGRAAINEWLHTKGISTRHFYLDNGSGLSDKTHVTGRFMTDLLAAAWQGPYMPEYLASLPITGVDGTMYKRKVAVGRGRIKTGFLRDVRSIGGVIYAKNGQRYAVYANVRGSKNMPGGIDFLNAVITYVDNLPKKSTVKSTSKPKATKVAQTQRESADAAS